MTTPTYPSAARGGARVPFTPLKIDYNTKGAIDLIKKYGSRFDWYSALVCPCTLKSQQVELKFIQLSCGLCNGTGWTFVLNSEIRIVPSSARREEQTLTYRVAGQGLMSNIFVNLTCEPQYKVNIRDRVVFKESVTHRSEVVFMDVEKTSYKLISPAIDLLHVIDETGKHYNSTSYYTDDQGVVIESRDISVNADGEIYWVEGKRKPPNGMAFTVLYSFFPAYDVITAAHEIRGFVAGKLAEEGGVQAWEDLPRFFTGKLVIPDAYLFG